MLLNSNRTVCTLEDDNELSAFSRDHSIPPATHIPFSLSVGGRFDVFDCVIDNQFELCEDTPFQFFMHNCFFEIKKSVIRKILI